MSTLKTQAVVAPAKAATIKVQYPLQFCGVLTSVKALERQRKVNYMELERRTARIKKIKSMVDELQTQKNLLSKGKRSKVGANHWFSVALGCVSAVVFAAHVTLIITVDLYISDSRLICFCSKHRMARLCTNGDRRERNETQAIKQDGHVLSTADCRLTIYLL